MAAEACIECDVAIVGAGFAGALIANELGKARKKVIVLEAGDPVPPNINEFMRRFYMAIAKVPESPYTPEIFDAAGNLSDPSKMNAGRPTVLSLQRKGGFGDWTDPKQSYLIQKGPTAIRQHLRSHRRRDGALARNLPEIRACRFQDENELPGRAAVRGLADWL